MWTETEQNRRARGAVLTVLTLQNATRYGERSGMPERVRDYLTQWGAVGLARDSAGQWVALCSEGVGGAIPDPAGWLAPDVPTERVDLADFVRTFGSRLEGNFSLWRERLAQVKPLHLYWGYVIFGDGRGKGTYGAACACGWHRDTGYVSPATAGRAVETHRRRHQVGGK